MIPARHGSSLGARCIGLLSAVTLAAFAGCGVEPLGSAPIRVTSGAVVIERWLADPGREEYVVVRDAANERSLLSVTDGSECDLGPNRLWTVVSRGVGEARETRIVLLSQAGTAIEVRGLDCAVHGAPVPIRGPTRAFVDDRTFVLLGIGDAGAILRVDLFDGTSRVIGHTDGPLGLENTTGDFDSGALWIRGDAPPPSRARFWVFEGGQLVVSEVGGSELGRAGTCVTLVERVERAGEIFWFRTAEGLFRWEVGVGDAALIVPGGCDLVGSSRLYVRSPCAVGELSRLTDATWERTPIATNVVDEYVSGSFLAFVTDVASVRHTFLMLADGAPREVPPNAVPLGTRGEDWILLEGTAVVALGPDGTSTPLFTGLAAFPRLLSDGRTLLYHDSDGSTGTLSVFDPDTLAVEELATGVPPSGYNVQAFALSGTSLVFVLHDAVDSVGVLDAMVWPDGPRVVVAEDVSLFWPVLYAEPASLFYVTAGADPALWVVPL